MSEMDQILGKVDGIGKARWIRALDKFKSFPEEDVDITREGRIYPSSWPGKLHGTEYKNRYSGSFPFFTPLAQELLNEIKALLIESAWTSMVERMYECEECHQMYKSRHVLYEHHGSHGYHCEEY